MEAPVDSATLLLRAETWRPGRIDKIVQKASDKIDKAESQAAKKAIKGESTTAEEAEVAKFKAKPKAAGIALIADAVTPDELDAITEDQVYA